MWSRMSSSQAIATAQKNINLTTLDNLVVPLCSLPEQQEIVRLLDEQFSVIEENEREIDAALKRSDALRQSILKKAFTGQLVPQDPSDEPASVLLERIRADKEKAAKPIKTAPKSRTTTRTSRGRGRAGGPECKLEHGSHRPDHPESDRPRLGAAGEWLCVRARRPSAGREGGADRRVGIGRSRADHKATGGPGEDVSPPAGRFFPSQAADGARLGHRIPSPAGTFTGA